MSKEFVSIEFHDLNVGQLLFVHAIVMPEIMTVIAKYVDDIDELEEEEN